MRAKDVDTSKPGAWPWWYTPRIRKYAGGAAEHRMVRGLVQQVATKPKRRSK